MTHRIEFSPAAARQLRKLDARARRRVQAVVELLAQEPPPRQREEAHRRQWVGQGFPNQLGHGSRVTEHRGCTPCVNLGRRTGASTMPPSVPTAPGGGRTGARLDVIYACVCQISLNQIIVPREHPLFFPVSSQMSFLGSPSDGVT